MLAFFSFSICCHLKNAPRAVAQLDDVYYKMRVEVRVLDIDQKTSYSYIEIIITLGPLPSQFNETGILVQILGGGDMMLFCNYTASDSYGKYFEGNSSGSWYFIGAGELFPFDYYSMVFRIEPLLDTNFTISEAIPIFHGKSQKLLLDIWETTNSKNEMPYHIFENGESVLVVTIKRRWVIPFLAFTLPIILCYYFLGATLFLNPKSRMQEILTVYLSLFVFIPTFFIGIQDFLPYRSLLSIPETLLTNLITSIGFLGFSTILSGYRRLIVIRNYRIPLEWFSLILALFFFAVYYWYLLLGILFQFASLETILTFLFVVVSYFVGSLGFSLRLKKAKQKSEKGQRFFVRYE